MFKAFVLAAFAAAAVNAASWPMITVNSAGDIVLNAPTRANSVQFTPVAVTAAPTGTTAGTRDTVTDLGAAANMDSDVFELTVPSGLATSGGLRLPTATVGRTITIFNAASTAAGYELWSSATSVFVGGTAQTSASIDASAAWVQAVAVSSTRWVLRTSATNAVSGKGFVNVATGVTTTSSTTTGTLTTAQMLNGQLAVTVAGAAFTYTTATAADLSAADANSANGDAYTFTLSNSATQVTGTDLSLTLAAGTGVTIPSDGTQLVVPGQTRVYSLYRTAAAAWTLVQRSSFILYPTSTLSISTAFTSTNSQTRTIHATRFNADIGALTASETYSALFVNSYFGLRDIVIANTEQSSGATAVHNLRGIMSATCDGRATGTIACQGAAGEATSDTFRFTIIKA